LWALWGVNRMAQDWAGGEENIRPVFTLIQPG